MVNIELVQIECPTCHILYWISEAHNKRLNKSKEIFYCPTGHSGVYLGKSDNQKYIEEQRKAERYEKYIKDKDTEIKLLNKNLKTKKLQITKLKNKNERIQKN